MTAPSLTLHPQCTEEYPSLPWQHAERETEFQAGSSPPKWKALSEVCASLSVGSSCLFFPSLNPLDGDNWFFLGSFHPTPSWIRFKRFFKNHICVNSPYTVHTEVPAIVDPSLLQRMLQSCLIFYVLWNPPSFSAGIHGLHFPVCSGLQYFKISMSVTLKCTVFFNRSKLSFTCGKICQPNNFDFILFFSVTWRTGSMEKPALHFGSL